MVSITVFKVITQSKNQFEKAFEELYGTKFFRWFEDENCYTTEIYFPRELSGSEFNKVRSFLEKLGGRVSFEWNFEVRDAEECDTLYSFDELLRHVKKNYREYLKIDSVKTFNELSQVNVKSPILETSKEERRGNGVTFIPLHRIYEVSIGVGASPIFLVTIANRKLNFGESKLYLRPIEFHPILNDQAPVEERFRWGVKSIAKKVGIPEIEKDEETGEKRLKTTKELWEETVEQHENESSIFYEITSPVPVEEVLCLQDVKGIVNFAVGGNGKLDDKLLLASKIWVVNLIPESATPNLVRYNPHSLVITNTKTGKTDTAKKIGLVLERPTVSGLIGFSTAEIISKGKLNKEWRTVFVDESQESKEDDSVCSGLLSIMETGEANIARGRGVYCLSHSTISFLGNVKEKNPINYLWAFEKNLRRLTSNFEAFGSRVGLILFGELETYKHSKEPEDNRYQMVLQAIQDILSLSFTATLQIPEVLKWLNTPMDKYSEEVLEFANAVDNSKLSEFLSGHVDAYRHIRGAALRLAIVNMSDILFSRLKLYSRLELDDVVEALKELAPDILEEADNSLDLITNLNLSSFNQMMDLIQKGDYNISKTKLIFENSPKYLQIFLKALCSHYEENKRRNIAVEELKDYSRPFLDSEKGFYRDPNKVMDSVLRKVEKINSDFDFLEITKREDIDIVQLIAEDDKLLDIMDRLDEVDIGSTYSSESETHKDIKKQFTSKISKTSKSSEAEDITQGQRKSNISNTSQISTSDDIRNTILDCWEIIKETTEDYNQPEAFLKLLKSKFPEDIEAKISFWDAEPIIRELVDKNQIPDVLEYKPHYFGKDASSVEESGD